MACENLKNRSRFLLRGVAIFLTVISAVKVSATRHGAAYSVLSKRTTKEAPRERSRSDHSSCVPCQAQRWSTPRLVYTVENKMSSINCSVNGEYLITCRQHAGEVFIPASFIKTFFEVYGEVTPSDDGRPGELYSFRSSYGALHSLPQSEYDPAGVFLNFHKYNVEVRPSILCVTASDGVPMATQWDKTGYFYAISIAQFGLSHHAKFLLDDTPTSKLQPLGCAESDVSNWKLGPVSSVKRVMQRVNGVNRPVLAFIAPANLTHAAPTLPLHTRDRVLCLHLKLQGPGGITVKIKTRRGSLGYVSYVLGDKVLDVKGDHVIYGLKKTNVDTWTWLTRDLFTDWFKGRGDPEMSSTWFLEIVEVRLHGRGYIDNMTISASGHRQSFMQAANWLVNNQDKAGGWPTSVPVKTRGIQLQPNWYSAMAQGQAMSVLVRAYNHTGNLGYLQAAVKALDIFTLDIKDGGIRTQFLGQLDWYEEYPTTPSTFVLNGFIFSLLGLYDVMKTAKGDGQELAERLWTSGLRSLKALLGLFDTGEGTLYDLRHVICHEPPNRARWDYHTVHIALVQEMAIIDGDPIFYKAAQRWVDYFNGKKSPHKE